MSKVRYCNLCGEVSDTTGKYCQKCYLYLKVHPEGVYKLPPKGEVHYAPNGDPICHICGMAYRKLGNHIAFRHHLTQEAYRELFNLYHNTKLSNDEYKETMREYNKRDYDKVVKENLIKGGVHNRTTNLILPGRRLGGYIKESIYKEGVLNENKSN